MGELSCLGSWDGAHARSPGVPEFSREFNEIRTYGTEREVFRIIEPSHRIETTSGAVEVRSSYGADDEDGASREVARRGRETIWPLLGWGGQNQQMLHGKNAQSAFVLVIGLAECLASGKRRWRERAAESSRPGLATGETASISAASGRSSDSLSEGWSPDCLPSARLRHHEISSAEDRPTYTIPEGADMAAENVRRNIGVMCRERIVDGLECNNLLGPVFHTALR